MTVTQRDRITIRRELTRPGAAHRVPDVNAIHKPKHSHRVTPLSGPRASDDEDDRAAEEIAFTCLPGQCRPPAAHLLGSEHALVA